MPITGLGLVLLSLIKKHVDVLVLPDSLGVVTVGIRGRKGHQGGSQRWDVTRSTCGSHRWYVEAPDRGGESEKTWEDQQKC